MSYRVRLKPGVKPVVITEYNITIQQEWQIVNAISDSMVTSERFGEIEIQQITDPEPEKINILVESKAKPQPRTKTQKTKPKKKSTRKR